MRGRRPRHARRVRGSLLDAGTGLRNVAGLLDGAPFRGSLLLSHLHWDHTQGLPFFTAGDRPDARVEVQLPPVDGDAAHALDPMMGPPFFPITAAALRGRWHFSTLDEGRLEVEGFQVLARRLPHPGGSTFGLRVSDGRSSMAYVPDHGPLALGPGPDGWGPYHEAVLELVDGVDLLLHDAPVPSGRTGRQGRLRPLGGRVRGRPRASAPASAGCCCSTTIPGAPTTRSMPSWTPLAGRTPSVGAADRGRHDPALTERGQQAFRGWCQPPCYARASALVGSLRAAVH